MSRSMILNRNVIEMEYAVRGPIPQRAAVLRQQGMKTIPCNIGNPQALGQKPISFYRQVLSLAEMPSRIGRERALNALRRRNSESFPGLDEGDFCSDFVLDFTDRMLGLLETGTGAYTDSKGPAFIRRAVADFIGHRDGVTPDSGVPADPEAIFLTDGASEGAKNILEALITNGNDGIMIPIPQYPLYSATITRCGGAQVNYYPDEENGWVLNRAILDEGLADARRRGVNLKAIVVINPGNPTGAILDEESVREVIGFARENGLAIIADEVYQENLYGGEFFSFARMLGDEREVTLFSLHSASKGFYGECGHRGGYMEVRNPPAVEGSDIPFIDVMFKQASVNLCSNTVGQILIYLMASSPEPGSDLYDQFNTERQGVLDDLYGKATMIREAFEQMEGMECFGRTGAMYLFPRLGTLPAGSTDFDYCMKLLETTGLCTVNGSGFGQKENTHHLRIAFLPPREMLEEILPRWIEFHNNYVTG